MRSSFPRSLASAVLAAALSGGCTLEHTGGTDPTVIATPTPTPAAPATPAPPVEVYGCGLPRGTGNGRNCQKESPQFMDAINAAIDKAMDERPELFRDLHQTGGQYMDEVVENLRKAGYCALNDGEEVAIKNSNDFSEQYDILSSGGHVLRGYMVTCRPAWDAIPPEGTHS